MSKLLRYSIETDRTVLLSFSDESNVRVPLSRVKEFVAPNELKKIENALQVRENFLKRHLPKLALGIVAGGLLVAGSFHENNVLNHLQKSSQKLDTAPPTEQSKKNIIPTPLSTQQSKVITSEQLSNKKSLSALTTEPAGLPKKHAHFRLTMPHLPKLLP